MTPNGKQPQLITHSRQACFKECRRKHWYSYELGLRRIEDARALRMGSAFHDGIDALGQGLGVGEACSRVRQHYQTIPEYIDQIEWDYECETIMRLVCAYDWRWASMRLEYLACELAFQLPLLNPATGARTPIFERAGKIDGIVKLEDGRLAVKETKTVSEDLGPDASLWRRLRMDQQISGYISAARDLGYAVDTVLYDIVRKPSISPTPMPIVDADGIKIVLDANGERVRNANKTWRQTGDKEKGFELQTRPMSSTEWGQKLTDDICSRPDYYFARVEIPRLDQDIAEYQQELWEIQLTMREAQRMGRHYRTVHRNTCGFCEYFDTCSTNQRIDRTSPPVGFQFVDDIHPELGRKEASNGQRTNSATAGASESPAASSVEAVA